MDGGQIFLSIIIVNWNGEPFVENCLNSIYTQDTRISYEVIVWDNASTDGSVSLIRQNFPQVKLIQSDKNLGFAGGNNRAFNHAHGEYYLLLNNDTVLREGTLDAMAEVVASNPSIGIWGFHLINPDGSTQKSAGRFPNIITEILDQTGLHKFIPYSQYAYSWYNTPEEADWVTGACMLIKRQVIEKIGMFDERYFMFLEDVDLCYRARKAGWQVRYHPKPTIVHMKGESSKPVLKKMIIQDRNSILYFVDKHYSRITASLFRIVVILGAFIRMVIWGIISLFTRKHSIIEKRNAYLAILLDSFSEKFLKESGTG